jgi:hypothetical protein
MKTATKQAGTPAATKQAGTPAATKEVKKQETTTAVAATPAATAVGQVMDFARDAGMGLENADKDSFAIPFLAILQSNSPQCQPVADGGVEGAQQGMLINSITNELMSVAHVVPVAFQRRYLGWAPRSSGGGFKGEFSVLDVDTKKQPWDWKEIPTDKGDMVRVMCTPEGNILKDTRNHFILLVREDGSWMPALLSLGSTQIKKSKRWLSLIQNLVMKDASGKNFNPPSFSHIYAIKTIKEENDKGVWRGIDITMEGQVADPDMYNAAKAFHAQIVAGKVETAPPVDIEPAGTGDNEQF